MPAQSTVFPAFIRAEYDPSGGGFPAFEQAAQASADRAKRHFEGSFAEIQQIAQRALAAPRNDAGALDLNVGRYREAATAANSHAAALREIATAAQRAAIANSDTSEETRLYVQAARAAAIEAETGARAANQQATAMDRLQTELNQTRSATQQVLGGNRALTTELFRGADGVRAQRFAYQQLGQQLTDVAIQAQMGVNPFVILVQQGSQAAFAMTGFRGAIGRVAAFLSGPWGAAVFGAAAVVGLLTGALNDNEEAAKNAELGADGLSEAQSALGEIFDLVSGKLEKQNDLLILNARLTAINLRAEALAERTAAGRTFGEVGERTVGGRVGEFVSTEGGGGVLDILRRQDQLRGRASSQSRLYQDVLARRTTIEQAMRQSESMDFKGLEVTRQEFQKALIDTVSAAYKVETARLIDESLDRGVLAPGLRREARDRRPRKPRDTTREVQSLEEFGRDTADKIADIAGRFGGQPKLIEQAAKAIRDLDDLTDDVIAKNARLVKLTGAGLPNFAQLLEDIEKTKGIVDEGLNRPFTEFLVSQEQALAVQKLLTAGREEEAEALDIIYRLEQQMGPLTESRKASILATVEAIRAEARETEVARAKMQVYLNAIDDVRANVQQTIEGFSSRGLKSIGDFVSGLRSTFNRLTAEVVTEQLFGDVFRQLEDMVTGRKPVEEAGERMAVAMDGGSSAVDGFASAVEAATARINDAAAGTAEAAAAAAEAAGESAEGYSEVVVTGRRMARPMSPEALVNRVMGDVLARIGGDLGKKIGQQVGTALAGAGIGQTAGGLLLGSRNNNTASAIGGAIGGVAGRAIGNLIVPGIGGEVGKVLGSALGGIVGGGLFGKSAPRGQAVITSATGAAAISGNKNAARQQAETLSTDVQGNVLKIAEALGGKIIDGVGRVAIGVYKDTVRVNTSGGPVGGVKGSGAINFGEDTAAAVKAATLDLIRDGMLAGIRAGALRLLQNAKDLEVGLDKALKFEGVFAELKRNLDPVGAALDEVNKRFEQLRSIFNEAGASAEEFADLEKLYGIERERAIKEASSAMTSALRGLLDELTVGNDALSLRDRLTAARAKYDPLAADLAAGKTVDYDAFAEAARNVLDIQRQFSGSQSGYFDVLDEVTGLTKKALADQENVISIATAKTTPFDSRAGSANDNAPVVSAIDQLGDRLVNALGGRLDALNTNVGRLVTGTGGVRPSTGFSLPMANF